jgi:hypothetical protein
MVLKGFIRLHPIGFAFKYNFNSSYRLLVPFISFKRFVRAKPCDVPDLLTVSGGVSDIEFYFVFGISFCKEAKVNLLFITGRGFFMLQSS